MKRKLDPKKLVLERNTVTILTTEQFNLIQGGGHTDCCVIKAAACAGGGRTNRC